MAPGDTTVGRTPIGQELDLALVFFVPHCHETQIFWAGCRSHQRVKPNELIIPDIATSGYWTIFPSDIVGLFFESSHESDPLLGPAAKELVVNVAAVHHHDAALWQTQGAGDFDFRHVAFGYVRVDRQITIMIQQHMQLDGSLGLAILCQVEHLQAKLDDGGV